MLIGGRYCAPLLAMPLRLTTPCAALCSDSAVEACQKTACAHAAAALAMEDMHCPAPGGDIARGGPILAPLRI